MSVRTKGALITWTTGRPDGPPVVLLHDRYLDHDANDALGARLAPTHRVISARAARTQMEMGQIKGYYWFLGALDQPELSTLGDPLSDAALMCVYRNPNFDDVLGMRAAWTSEMLPGADDLAQRYAVASAQELQNWDFYMALAYFKLAIIAAGIDFRRREGSDAPAQVGEAVAPLIAEGLAAL